MITPIVRIVRCKLLLALSYLILVIFKNSTEPKNVAPGQEENSDNYILVDGKKYYLRQFHFHMPSEHMVNGVRKVAEVHFVHTDATNSKVVVVGAFIACGIAANSAYKAVVKGLPAVFKNMPKREGKGLKITLKEVIDVRKLLPLSISTKVYRYLGSKTSGNLASGVEWVIFTTPIEFSRKQLDMFEPIRSLGTKIHPKNGRHIRVEHVAVA